MTCQETRQILGGYFDGELDLVYRLDIEGHLRRCAGCAETLKRYQGAAPAAGRGSFPDR